MKTILLTAISIVALASSGCGDDDDQGGGSDAGAGDSDSDGDTDGDADGDADTDADSDTDGDADADLDADADGDADGDAGPWFDGGDWEGEPIEDGLPWYKKDRDGHFTVISHRMTDDEKSDLSTAARAQFYKVYVEPNEPVLGEILMEAEGTDSCRVWRQDDWGGDSMGSMDFLEAGVLTVSFGDSDVEIESWLGGVVVNYDGDLSAYTPAYGEPYSFHTSGDEIGPMTIDPACTLPKELVFTGMPFTEDWTVPRAALPFEWEAGDPDATLKLRLRFDEVEDVGGGFSHHLPFYFVDCEITDDGAFEVPLEALELVPSGKNGMVSFTRADAAIRENGLYRIATACRVVEEFQWLTLE